MFRGYEAAIALRYLRSRRKEVFISIITVISVLGVAVSVLVLNMVLSIMDGFERELKAKLVSANAHIVVRSFTDELVGWKPVKEKVDTIAGVKASFPYSYSQALLTVGKEAQGLYIRGIPDDSAAREKLSDLKFEGQGIASLFVPHTVEVSRPDGSVDEVKLPPIIVGRELARRFGLTPGTAVTVLSPQLSSSPQGLIPKARRFLVVEEYNSGLVEYESGIAYVALADAQSFFGLGEAVSGLEIEVASLDMAPGIADTVRESFTFDYQGRGESSEVETLPKYQVIDWTQHNKPLWDALKLEKRVYFIVLLLLILVASFSVVSTLVMIVMEKSKDIAILKTIGATDRSVMNIFLLQGTFIGLSGTILGTLLGYLGCVGLRKFPFHIDEKVFTLSAVPVNIAPTNFFIVALAGFFITSLAGLYPAWRAARLKPADALRFE